MGNRSPAAQEWFEQARYDLGTAEAMFDAGRYIYVVFMCHLAIKKALKGIIQDKSTTSPPRTHNLVALATEAVPGISDDRMLFLARISQASVPTRYPERLSELQSHFNRLRVEGILVDTKETIEWIEALT
jgi:HEPN domain-containing protein